MKRFIITKAGLLMLVIALALGLTPVAGAQSTNDPAALLAAFEKVAFGNTQDIEAALALFSDGAVLTVMPAPAGTTGVWTGKDEIRKGLLYNKQQNVARVNSGTPKVDGNKVTTSAKVTNNFFQMIGVAPVEHTTEVVAEGGKIKSYTSTMLAAEQQRVGAAAKAFQASASLPNTGAGPQPSQSSSFLFGIGLDLTTLLVGLMAIGLLSLGGLFLVRRTNSQAR